MKKTILWGLAFLFVIAIIPLSSIIEYNENSISAKVKEASTDESPVIASETFSEEIKLDKGEIEIIVCKVMEHITEDANTETKKAILAVCKNNYLYLKENKFTDFDANISKYSDSFLEELYSLYEENDFQTLLNGKHVPIPLTEQNGGYTATNDEYPYILNVASPWDTFSKSYIRGAQYAGGVSIYGISYLCENGMQWNEALNWYLPNFTIT